MRPLAALLVAYCAAASLALPLTDVPVIDDWAYAYSVDKMLQTGDFRVLDYSCRYNLVQVLWGVLFSLPAGGVSFVALRLSTFVLGALGVAAFYDLLRRRTGNQTVALWTAALLAFNPLFFRLSLSFMTDVPLLAVVASAFWLLDRALSSGRALWLAAALGVVVAGYLVRELAIVAPAAIVLSVALAGGRRFSVWILFSLAALAVVGLGAELGWMRSHGATWGLETRTEGLRYLLEVPVTLYVWALLHMLLTAAALVAPLAFALRRSRRDVGVALAGGLVCAVLALAVGAIPFGATEVLSPLGLGMTRALMPGDKEISTVGQLLRAVVFVLACVSLATLLQVFVQEIRGWGAVWLGWGDAAAEPNAIDVAWTLFALGQVAALLILWLWQDRYDLVLVPSALWLLALRAWRRGFDPRVAAAGAVLFALTSVLGTRDDFALNRAAWATEAWLRQRGVPARDIDGGYILNGWRLYAYADQLAPGFPVGRVPFLFSKDELPYQVSTTPLAGLEVVHTDQWARTWLGGATIYALRRME